MTVSPSSSSTNLPPLPADVKRRSFGSEMGDEGFVTESPVKDQLRPEAQAIGEVLQRVDGMAGEGLRPSGQNHRRSQLPPAGRAA